MPIPGSSLNNLVDTNRLAPLVTEAYPSLCTIYRNAKTQQTTGEYTNTFLSAMDSRHTNIHCRKSPEIMVRPQPQEKGSNFPLQEQKYWIVNLLGNFSDIDLEFQAEVDGKRYQILAVDGDGSGITTRLEVADLDPYNA